LSTRESRPTLVAYYDCTGGQPERSGSLLHDVGRLSKSPCRLGRVDLHWLRIMIVQAVSPKDQEVCCTMQGDPASPEGRFPSRLSLKISSKEKEDNNYNPIICFNFDTCVSHRSIASSLSSSSAKSVMIRATSPVSSSMLILNSK